jgi:hypothetical protein
MARLMQSVTEADGRPVGWICEGCGSLYGLDDYVYGWGLAVTADGMVVDDWRCLTCWHTEE